MSYLAHVKFCYDEGPMIKHHCFSILDIREVKEVKYFAEICPLLSSDEVTDWIDFICDLLPEVSAKKNKKTVDFSVACDTLTNKKVLLALSLCRYVQEFPEIVKLFHENAIGELSADFLMFQKNSKGDICRYYNNLTGHGVFYLGYQTPIKLETFRNNWKKDLNSVVSYFK